MTLPAGRSAFSGSSAVTGWWSATTTFDTLVTPDGTADFMWSPGRQPWLACPDASPSLSTLEPGITVVGVRLAPGAVAALTSETAVDLVGLRLSASDVVPASEADRLFTELHERPTAAGAIITAWVTQHIGKDWAPDPEVVAEIHRLRSRAPAPVSTLGPRQLRRRFSHAMGYGPKFFEKICRFDRFTNIVTANPHMSLARAAATAGFSDQSHLARDCRRLTGRTPTAVVGTITDHRPPA